MFETCTLAVFAAMNSSAPISLLLCPADSSCSTSSSLAVSAVGRALELEVGGARVGKGDAHEGGLLTRSSAAHVWLSYQLLALHN